MRLNVSSITTKVANFRRAALQYSDVSTIFRPDPRPTPTTRTNSQDAQARATTVSLPSRINRRPAADDTRPDVQERVTLYKGNYPIEQ
jgi:hypothetical protein